MYIAPCKAFGFVIPEVFAVLSCEEIRETRALLKKSRKEFARMMWVGSPETVKSWEVGRRNPEGPALLLLHNYRRLALEKQEEARAGLQSAMAKKKTPHTDVANERKGNGAS